MLSSMRLARVTAAVWLTACGGSAGSPAAGPPLDSGPTPGSYEDPFVPLDQVVPAGNMEIQEVRARDDGLVLLCTGRRGLILINGSDPAALTPIAELDPSLGSVDTPRCFHLAWAG